MATGPEGFSVEKSYSQVVCVLGTGDVAVSKIDSLSVLMKIFW